MQQCAMALCACNAHCACKMAAMLTRETSELTGRDLWRCNGMAFQTSTVTVLLLFHLLARIKYEIKIFTLTVY